MKDRHFVLVLVSVTSLVFAQVAWFDVLEWWDDAWLVTKNSRVIVGDPSSLVSFWSSPQYEQYIPLTTTIWWAALTMFGESSLHLLNFLFYLPTVCLVFFCLRRLYPENQIGALFGALVFAIHPAHAGAIAWITAFRSVLMGFLFFLSFWLYLNRDSWRGYALSLVIFAVSMTAKSNAVILAPLIVLCDFALLKKTNIREWSGFFLVAIPVLAIVPSLQQGALGSPVVIFDTIGFYFTKILTFSQYVPYYGRTKEIAASSDLFLLGIFCLFLVWEVKKIRIPGAIFLLLLLPNSGVFQFFFQDMSTVANRYLYLSIFGVSCLVASFNVTRFYIGLVSVVCALFLAQSLYLVPKWKTHNSITKFAIENTEIQSRRLLKLAGNYYLSHGQKKIAFDKFEQAYRGDPYPHVLGCKKKVCLVRDPSLIQKYIMIPIGRLPENLAREL